jgi:hypothetical protein
VTANEIFTFCSHLPANPRAGDCIRHIIGNIPGADLDAPSIQFVDNYRNLRFGWDSVETLAKAHKPYPAIGRANNEYVWKAYLYCCDAILYNDPALQGAFFLMAAQNGRRREILNGLLACKGMTATEAADQIGMRRDTVRAYEQLFFNVIDRKLDEALMAELIYPQTRMVEFAPGYLENESIGNHLLRAGYNIGVKEVLHLAGFHTDLVSGLAGADATKIMEDTIMANGVIMARNHFTHANSHFAFARGMMNAKQIGGAINGAETSPFGGGVAESMMGEVVRYKTDESGRRIKRAQANEVAYKRSVIDI